MNLTAFHAVYYANVLMKSSSSNSVEKLAAVLSDAQVDLNPHQIEAALFSLKNSLAKGVILADEVGLGKTVEAGIVTAQKWAEEKWKQWHMGSLKRSLICQLYSVGSET